MPKNGGEARKFFCEWKRYGITRKIPERRRRGKNAVTIEKVER